jgi:alkylation response protein AidB-like acyl-CoA dehydrogenase
MDFRVGDDQRELAEGIRSMLAGRLPLDKIRTREGSEHAIDGTDWVALGETGVFALTLPEPEGTGLGLADAVVVFEELGRALVPGPLVGTFLAARSDAVPGAAAGTAQVGVTSAAGTGPVLIEHLGSLDALLVLAPDGPPQLLHPAPTGGARRLAHPLDPLTPLWALDALPFGGDVSDNGGRLWRDGALLTAALQVGHATAVLDQAVAYAKGRYQFGQPIGSFQAIKHMCADMLVRAEVARTAVHAAACLADAPDVAETEAKVSGCTPHQLLERSVSGAKLLADEAALTNARAAIQVHGGMGFTWEIPLHLHLKRSRVLSTTFGTPGERAAALAVYA